MSFAGIGSAIKRARLRALGLIEVSNGGGIQRPSSEEIHAAEFERVNSPEYKAEELARKKAEIQARIEADFALLDSMGGYSAPVVVADPPTPIPGVNGLLPEKTMLEKIADIELALAALKGVHLPPSSQA